MTENGAEEDALDVSAQEQERLLGLVSHKEMGKPELELELQLKEVVFGG